MFKNKVIALVIIGSLQAILLHAMVAEKKRKVESQTFKKEEMTTLHFTIINKTKTEFLVVDLLNIAGEKWKIPAEKESNITIAATLFPIYPNPHTNLLRLDPEDPLSNLLVYVSYPLTNVGSSRIKTINVHVDSQTLIAKKRLTSTLVLDIVKNPELFITFTITGRSPFFNANLKDETEKKLSEYKRLKDFQEKNPFFLEQFME